MSVVPVSNSIDKGSNILVNLSSWSLSVLLTTRRTTRYSFRLKPSPSLADLYTNSWLCYFRGRKRLVTTFSLEDRKASQYSSSWALLLVIVLVCCLVGQKNLFSYFHSEYPLLFFCWTNSFTSWDVFTLVLGLIGVFMLTWKHQIWLPTTVYLELRFVRVRNRVHLEYLTVTVLVSFSFIHCGEMNILQYLCRCVLIGWHKKIAEVARL